MDRERRKKSDDVRALNASVNISTFEHLKAEAKKQRVSYGVVLDQLVTRMKSDAGRP